MFHLMYRLSDRGFWFYPVKCCQDLFETEDQRRTDLTEVGILDGLPI